MARFESDFAVHADNAAGGVHPAAAEFAMMGISPKVQTCPFGCDSKLSELKQNYDHLEKLYNDFFIQVQAYENTVKTLEHQKDWFDKWKESSKNLAKLLYSSMSTRTKLSLGFKEYIGSDEVCDLSTPSVFDPKPNNREVKSLYERFVKVGNMHEVPSPITGTFMPTSYQSDLAETQETFGSKSNTSSIPTSKSNDFVSCDNSDKSSASKTYDFTFCVSSPKTNDSFSTVDVKLLPKSDNKDPSLTNGLPSCSFKENVKPPRNLYNFPFVVSKAASVPASSRNSLASISAGRCIPAASRNGSAFIHAGRSIPVASRKKPASIHAGKRIPVGRINKPAPFPAGSSVPTGWTNPVHPHVNKDIGIVDSGCSRSMTGNKEKLEDFMQVKGGTVTFGGGDGKITRKCTIRTSKLNFKNVYFVEELQNFNLFSVSQICDKKNKVLFTDDACLVLSKDFQLPDESQVVLQIPRRHDLYTFNLSDIQPEQHINCLLAKASLEESTKWHRRMAHVNFKTINKLAKHGLVEGLPLKLFTNEHNCVACNKGKQHKALYKAISAVFITLIENQLNKKVKAIRCDNGTEFQNAKLIALCREKEIKRDYSNARTSQKNGVAERKNRTLIEAERSMLADSKLPTMFWTEAVSTACYVLNRVSITNPHNKTPYELLSRKVPNIQHLKPFGYQVTILNTSDHLGKFEGKANDSFLIGYAAH
nr:putative ribonuclease H-like domain-containing protein [Tanacetum cinerariifolium]